ANRADGHQRMIGVFGEVLLGRIVLGGDVDRNTVGGAIEFAREEGFVVGRVVPGRNAGNKGIRERLGIVQRLHGLARVAEYLVILVDGPGVVAPEDPVQPAIGVAGGVSERKTGGRVVGLQGLAHLEEAREVLRKLLEAGLVGRRFAVGHVAAAGRD